MIDFIIWETANILMLAVSHIIKSIQPGNTVREILQEIDGAK